MLGKISTAQFPTLYRELAGDCSASDNFQSKECDERWEKIIKHIDAGILRDSLVNNGRIPK